ncbi:MAG: T9SS type A sorting domain-containing protein [Bacteroidota bacterium]|nr:T9SS type A sorting domain-containing protein [Bacteroidota bacterium]
MKKNLLLLTFLVFFLGLRSFAQAPEKTFYKELNFGHQNHPRAFWTSSSGTYMALFWTGISAEYDKMNYCYIEVSEGGKLLYSRSWPRLNNHISYMYSTRPVPISNNRTLSYSSRYFDDSMIKRNYVIFNRQWDSVGVFLPPRAPDSNRITEENLASHNGFIYFTQMLEDTITLQASLAIHKYSTDLVWLRSYDVPAPEDINSMWFIGQDTNGFLLSVPVIADSGYNARCYIKADTLGKILWKTDTLVAENQSDNRLNANLCSDGSFYDVMTYRFGYDFAGISYYDTLGELVWKRPVIDNIAYEKLELSRSLTLKDDNLAYLGIGGGRHKYVLFGIMSKEGNFLWRDTVAPFMRETFLVQNIVEGMDSSVLILGFRTTSGGGMYFSAVAFIVKWGGKKESWEGEWVGVEEDGNNSAEVPCAPVYPNPFTGNVTFTVPVTAQGLNVHVEVINMLGEVVYAKDVHSAGTEAMLSHLPPAVYFYRIILKDEVLCSGKMVKN